MNQINNNTLISETQCDNVFGLQQIAESCWFNTVLFALFFPDISCKHFINTFNKTQLANPSLNKLFLLLTYVINKIRTGDQIQTKYNTDLLNSFSEIGDISIDSWNNGYNASEFIAQLFALFGVPYISYNLKVQNGNTIYSQNKSYYINVEYPIDNQLFFNDHVILTEDTHYLIIYNRNGSEIESVLTCNMPSGTKQMVLQSIIVQVGGHYVTFSKCTKNMEWYVYDGENSKKKIKINKINNFFVNKRSYANNGIIYDYTVSSSIFIYMIDQPIMGKEQLISSQSHKYKLTNN